MADFLKNIQEGDGVEMMSDKTLNRLIAYLKNIKGWSDIEIVSMLDYISSK